VPDHGLGPKPASVNSRAAPAKLMTK